MTRADIPARNHEYSFYSDQKRRSLHTCLYITVTNRPYIWRRLNIGKAIGLYGAGTRLGHYVIQKKLRGGGMGDCLRAAMRSSSARSPSKILPAELSADDQIRGDVSSG